MPLHIPSRLPLIASAADAPNHCKHDKQVQNDPGTLQTNIVHPPGLGPGIPTRN
jgi:hypothetical protein